MPRGGGRGYKGGHKGQRRHFTSPEELEAMREKEERERNWREQQGDESSDEEKEGETEGKSASEESGDEAAVKNAAAKKAGDDTLPVDNPNRVVNKSKKITQLDLTADAKPELSRKEREEIEKQRAKANYQRLHAEGKTEEARSDLARLAIIKKQREEAAKKREEERKAKEAAKAAKTESLNKALGKGRKT